jgi:hypothetical protein
VSAWQEFDLSGKNAQRHPGPERMVGAGKVPLPLLSDPDFGACMVKR